MNKEYKDYILNNARKITDECEKEIYDMTHYTLEQIESKLKSMPSRSDAKDKLINSNEVLKAFINRFSFGLSAESMALNEGYICFKTCCIPLDKFLEMRQAYHLDIERVDHNKKCYEYYKNGLGIKYFAGVIEIVVYDMHIDEFIGEI
jgi:hypothetical protein